MEQYAQAVVQQGLDLLRSKGAPLDRINLDTLDTGHVSKCILACAYGSYGKGKTALGLKTNEAGIVFGFWYPREFNPRDYYIVLTEAWRTALKALA